MEIQYIGENLFTGQLGHFAINLSFLFALLSALFYVLKTRRKGSLSNPLLPRIFFLAHVFLFLVSMASLYYLIFNHHFEYRYVWQHSSTEMSDRFLFSCFWAGQEGSFFIWGFFQAILGAVLLLTVKDWEAPVMAIVALAQVFLTSMLLGADIAGLQIGGDPFVLLRDTARESELEFFSNPEYLRFITDGNGLNPLLENYWMAIHPPVLFVGYASILIPFAYATAGLWTGRYRAWVKEVRSWVLFSAFFLGLGLLLGGAWAYIALTFGGFWAWDPVENASLVPWLAILAALHFILAGRNHNLSHLAAFVFTTFAYVMVLYASFLTRSGILTETSVHSFGDDGLMLQLVLFVVSFLILSIGLFAYRYKHLVRQEKENTLSREFWMFVGAMVLILSAFQIIFSTSIPVVNQIFGTSIAPPLDPVAYYNRWQLPYVILISLLIGFSQYLSYGQNRKQGLWKKVLPAFIAGIVLTTLTAILFEITYGGYLLMLFGLFFAMASAVAWWKRTGWSLSKSGAMVTHFGFALFLVGVVITFTNEIVISQNTSRFDLSAAGSNEENQLLVKGDTMPMAPYAVTYTHKYQEGSRTFFNLEFLKESEEGKWEKAFTLAPNINENQRMGNVYDPATANLLTKDVYVYISYADLSPQGPEKFEKIREAEVASGDTVTFGGMIAVVDSLSVVEQDAALENVWLRAYVRVIDAEGNEYPLLPEYRIHKEMVGNGIVGDAELGYGLRFEKVSDIPGAIILGIYQEQMEFIVLKAIIFPYINILWTGSILMLLGFVISFIRRVRKKKA